MSTPVFLTVDIEYAWRHHRAGLDDDAIFARSIEPAGVGLAFQLERLAAYRLKACFFVDPMPALRFGIGPIRRIVAAIQAAGQEVQLHLHPQWRAGDDAAPRFDLNAHPPVEQHDLIATATALLVDAGAPVPVAFRAGSYAADRHTLAALAARGFRYDSSHNGAAAKSRTGLPRRCIAPVERGVIAVPVTVIEDRPGSLRPFQLCALSTDESRQALHHAARHRHAAVTIVSHGFELANRAGTRANAVHVRRFEALCRMLAEQRAALPTTHFADRPALALGHDDQPLGPDRWRTHRRQAEQLWSNMVAERAA